MVTVATGKTHKPLEVFLENICQENMSEKTGKKHHRKFKGKSKPKRHKPKVSKKFQETENEITDILNSSEWSVDKNDEPESLGVRFFCNNVDSSISHASTEENVVETESPGAHTVASFIQVEDDDPIKRIESERIHFDESALFIPSPSINPYIQSKESSTPILQPSPNLIRVVNRYFEEGSHGEITSPSSLRNQIKFFKDDLLYATICQHEFRPIFCVIKPGEVNSLIIPSRKLLTITIKKLQFTEHPLQKEEHVMCSKLEEMLHVYFERKEKNVISKLQTTLDDTRTLVNSLLEEADQGNILDLEVHLNSVKELRTKLHQEELVSKSLLRDLLDNWIKLKNLRKRQKFHWTSLKLIIKLNKTDLDEDTSDWNTRFATELNEIYREELETYYREKRLWRQESHENIAKPKKPNVETIKKDLEEILKKCQRLPGEPEVDIVCSTLSDPSQSLEKIKAYYMRIFFDGQFVGATKSFRLEPDLSLLVNESFGIYLERRIPKEIKIKLYEKKNVPSVPIKIANVLVPLASVSEDDQHWEVISFSSHKRNNISGKLIINVFCEEGLYSSDVLQRILPPPISRTQDKLLPTSGQKKFVTYAQATEYVESPRTEPTSEEDNEVDVTNCEADQNACTFQESLLELCPQEEIDNNPRLRYLASLYRQDMKTKDAGFLPYFNDELDEESEKVIEIGNWMDPIDVHKHNGKKHIRNLYDVVRNHCEKLTLITGHSDEILVGNNMETLMTFLKSLFSFAVSPTRPLNPDRTTKPSITNLQNVQKLNILVNVVRATGIPVRTPDRNPLERIDSTGSVFSTQTFKYSNVRPFVSISYADRSARTMTVDGSSPTWNEQLILQIQGTPTELKGELKISIFDEYIENQINDELAMEVHQRFHANWLGEYNLPISTILEQQRIEGVFQMNSPRVLLGYNPPSLNEALPIENIPEIKERVNLWAYVSVEPNFEMPSVRTEHLQCFELKEVRQHIHEWCIEVRNMQPARFIDPLVCTMDGKRVCLTRLLEPVPLPIETSNNLIETACRYVSLLNVLKEFNPCMRFQGIWLNNQTLLDTGWGSQKDLGVLLANFMLTIGIRCWVILGVSYSFGESAYVLHKEELEFVILDPSSGKKFSTRDTFCPMHKVFYIFSQDNIFCNIQKENRVSMTNFDVDDSSCWFPMFTKKSPAPLGGIQKLNYLYPNSQSTTELRKNIERKIMKKINAWRPMQKTIWNRAFQNTMHAILVDLEYESTFASDSSFANHSEKIVSEFGTYKLFGFTLNFSYTNLSSISERIKSTGIHLNSDKRVEFCVAVHVHSYPFNVLSVWVFLISAVPK